MAQQVTDDAVRQAVELERINRLLSHQTVTDSLTALGNRSAFVDRLATEFANLQQSDALLSLVVMDIDRFKTFNDDFGHHAGDEVLVLVGDVLHKSLRSGDFCARYGGEEFVAILSHTDEAAALAIVTRMLRQVEATENPYRTVTLSAGIATSALRNTTEKELFEMADRAMYAAKKAGRNRVVLHSDLDQEQAEAA